MNISLRLFPLWGPAKPIVWRPFTVSCALAAKRTNKPAVVAKVKPKAEKIGIWHDITIKQLAEATKRPLDDVFEAIIYLESKNDYSRQNDCLEVNDAIKILKLLGYRGVVGAVPVSVIGERLQGEMNHLDATRQPPPKAEQLRPRRPVVTVMGHVDHGKTTLLDTLRNSCVVDQEFGGITQHIGAFSVPVPQCAQGAITFLDTPGHAAFSAMRARGADVTDMVVLVVAADDGVMEQTVESIRFANNAQVPMVVAVNKMDKHQADFDRVKNGLLAYGLQSDTDGGDVQFVPISALKGDGIDKLLEAIILQGEILDLKAVFEGLSEGYIIESSTHPHRGKLATILVDRGTVRKGSFIVAGTSWCKVRTILDELGKPISEVPPGCAAQVTGWKTLPNAGDLALEVENEKRAKEVTDLRLSKEENVKLTEEAKVIAERTAEERAKYREALEAKWSSGNRYYSAIMEPPPKESSEEARPTLRIVIKGDTDGSVEALLNVLNTYDKHSECRLDVMHFGVGPVTKNDLEMAKTFKGIVYAMHVGLSPDLKAADSANVKIKEFKVIYHLIGDLKREISSRLPHADAEETLGEASVLQEFMVTDERIKKKVPVAGCRCVRGELKRTEHFKLMRNEDEVYSGPIASMKHLKDETNTIKKDVECGIMLNDSSVRPKPGDVLVCVRRYKQPQTTSWSPPGF